MVCGCYHYWKLWVSDFIIADDTPTWLPGCPCGVGSWRHCTSIQRRQPNHPCSTFLQMSPHHDYGIRLYTSIIVFANQQNFASREEYPLKISKYFEGWGRRGGTGSDADEIILFKRSGSVKSVCLTNFCRSGVAGNDKITSLSRVIPPKSDRF